MTDSTSEEAIRAQLDEATRLDVPPAPSEAQESEAQPSDQVSAPLPRMPFPVSALPPVVRDYVDAVSKALPCSPALVAPLTLAVLAAAVGNSLRIKLKRSWIELANLWVVVIAPSGSKKSPAFEKAIAPIEMLEAEAFNKWKEDNERWELEQAEAESHGRDPDPSLEPVDPKRYRLQDVTVEAAAARLAESPRGLIMALDELAGWIGSLNRYGGGSGSDAQSWIALGEGRGLTVDRKGDPPFIYIERANVSVCGTIQPSVYREKMGHILFGSGFAARILVSQPEIIPSGWTDEDIDADVEGRYIALVRSMYEIEEQEEPINLSPEAKAHLVSYVNDNAALVHALPDGPMRAALAKIEGRLGRIALVLHAAMNGGQGEIAGQTMLMASVIATWFRYETARVYTLLDADEIGLSDDEKLASKLPTEFGWKDIQDAGGLSGRSSAYAAKERLIKKGLAIRTGPNKYTRTAPGQDWTLDFLDRLDNYRSQEAHLSTMSSLSSVHLDTEKKTTANPSMGADPKWTVDIVDKLDNSEPEEADLSTMSSLSTVQLPNGQVSSSSGLEESGVGFREGVEVDTPAGPGVITSQPFEGMVSVEVDDMPCSFPIEVVHPIQ